MFAGALSFNQSMGGWDTSRVANMSGMFDDATAFNQSVVSWDTSRVTNMSYMFVDASSFNQSLGDWNISEVVDMSGMLDDSMMSVDNYDSTLIGWANVNKVRKPNVVLGPTGLNFSVIGKPAHDALTRPDSNNWEISDGGLVPAL